MPGSSASMKLPKRDNARGAQGSLCVNRHEGFTIAVSESKHVAHIAKRTVLSDNALPTLVPILEDIAEWSRSKIRQLFESYGFLVQGWESVQTDWLTLLPNGVVTEGGGDCGSRLTSCVI
jgi:hypothetical protein